MGKKMKEINNLNSSNILLIDKNLEDKIVLKEIMNEVKGLWINLLCFENLELGLERLDMGGIDLVIMDVDLDDNQSFEIFEKVHKQSPHIPVVVTSRFGDKTFVIHAVKSGTSDYLKEDKEDNNLLLDSICNAIENHRLEIELNNPAFIDDLTGLYNWRGFLFLTKNYFKLNGSAKEGMWLFFVDFKDLLHFDSDLNYYKGNKELIETARMFKKSFRESDIIARVGGGVFAILAIGASRESFEVINSRFQKSLELYNKEKNRNYKLSFNLGAAYFNPESPCSIDELITTADKSLYEQNRNEIY